MAETVVGVLSLLTLVGHGQVWPLVSGAAVAPLLLMRTPQSISRGVERLAWFGRWLGIRSGQYEGHPWRLAGALLLLGAGSLGIKMLTALEFGWRWSSFIAIPKNYEDLVTRIDWRAPPELVPGAEAAYATHRDGLLTLSDMRWNFARMPNWMDAFFRRIPRHLPTSALGVILLGGFFLIAWLYRFSLKATCLIYWPFLLVHRYDDDGQIDKQAIGMSLGDMLKAGSLASVMVGVGALALVQLLFLAGHTAGAGLLTGWLPEWAKSVATVIGPVAWPKIFLTAIFLMSVFYFLTFVARACMHHGHKITGNVQRSELRFWRGTFKAAAMLQNTALCLATGILLWWAWPRFLARVGGLWGFFF